MNEILKKLLPTLATVLAGPLAGLAVQAVGSAFGMEDATKEKVTDLLSGNQPLSGEQVAALKRAEMELVVRLKELDIKAEELVLEKEKAVVQDRSSARLLFEKASNLIGAISVVTILSFGVMVYAVLAGKMKGYSSEEYIIVGTVIGYLASYTQQIYNYFFGSSSGSDKKTDGLMTSISKLGNGNGNGH